MPINLLHPHAYSTLQRSSLALTLPAFLNIPPKKYQIMGNTTGKRTGQAKTFEELSRHVDEANLLASNYTDSHGRKVCFELCPKHYNDVIVPFLWKALVHVRVMKHPLEPQVPKLFTYQQFYTIYFKLKEYEQMTPNGDEKLSASVFFPSNDPQASSSALEKECAICMERDATLVLPCLHCFCEQCIKIWKNKSETCPMCRVALQEQTEDCFVLANPPTDVEVKSYFSGFFDHLDNLEGLDFTHR